MSVLPWRFQRFPKTQSQLNYLLISHNSPQVYDQYRALFYLLKICWQITFGEEFRQICKHPNEQPYQSAVISTIFSILSCFIYLFIFNFLIFRKISIILSRSFLQFFVIGWAIIFCFSLFIFHFSIFFPFFSYYIFKEKHLFFYRVERTVWTKQIRAKIKTNCLYSTKLFLYGWQVDLLKCENLIHSSLSLYFLSL